MCIIWPLLCVADNEKPTATRGEEVGVPRLNGAADGDTWGREEGKEEGATEGLAEGIQAAHENNKGSKEP